MVLSPMESPVLNVAMSFGMIIQMSAYSQIRHNLEFIVVPAATLEPDYNKSSVKWPYS